MTTNKKSKTDTPLTDATEAVLSWAWRLEKTGHKKEATALAWQAGALLREARRTEGQGGANTALNGKHERLEKAAEARVQACGLPWSDRGDRVWRDDRTQASAAALTAGLAAVTETRLAVLDEDEEETEDAAWRVVSAWLQAKEEAHRLANRDATGSEDEDRATQHDAKDAERRAARLLVTANAVAGFVVGPVFERRFGEPGGWAAELATAKTALTNNLS